MDDKRLNWPVMYYEIGAYAPKMGVKTSCKYLLNKTFLGLGTVKN